MRQGGNYWLGSKFDFRVKEIKLLMNLCLLFYFITLIPNYL